MFCELFYKTYLLRKKTIIDTDKTEVIVKNIINLTCFKSTYKEKKNVYT